MGCNTCRSSCDDCSDNGLSFRARAPKKTAHPIVTPAQLPAASERAPVFDRQAGLDLRETSQLPLQTPPAAWQVKPV